MSLDASVRGVFGNLFRYGTIELTGAKTRLGQRLLASFPFTSCKLAAFAPTWVRMRALQDADPVHLRRNFCTPGKVKALQSLHAI